MFVELRIEIRANPTKFQELYFIKAAGRLTGKG
jgi:hypothetical protein